MKTLGMVGGIAPESTIAYYRAVIAEYKLRNPDGSLPPIIINSINMTKMLDLISAGKFAEVTEFLSAEVERLAAAGAGLGLFASNTPHIVFDEVKRRSPIPLISIVECAAAEAERRGLKRLALFGTRFTMQAKFYPEVFARTGMTVVLPKAQEQEFIHRKYMSELLEANFREETRIQMLAIVDRLTREEHIDAVILGGTELPLLLRMDDRDGIPLLDTSRIHAETAVAEMLRN